jgi:hypothetical protein
MRRDIGFVTYNNIFHENGLVIILDDEDIMRRMEALPQQDPVFLRDDQTLILRHRFETCQANTELLKSERNLSLSEEPIAVLTSPWEKMDLRS